MSAFRLVSVGYLHHECVHIICMSNYLVAKNRVGSYLFFRLLNGLSKMLWIDFSKPVSSGLFVGWWWFM